LRQSQLRRPRRVQRRNECGWTLYRVCSARDTGGDGAARRPYRADSAIANAIPNPYAYGGQMSYLSQKRFYWLDWFRFLAAFEVVACHARLGVWTHYDQLQASSKNWLTWIFFASTHLGNEAVVLFFVLSGYLVGGKVLQRTFDRSFDTSAYVLDRVTRIYVPFLPALIVSGIIGYAIGARPLSLFEFLGNLVVVQFEIAGLQIGIRLEK
jgi:hypothetical protein